MLSLTSRQSWVLNQVVDTFIQTGHPVSSQAVAAVHPEQVSSATVRHEMGALEEFGYLAQVHHASGRMPTDRGYRHYLDSSFVSRDGYRQYFEELSQSFSERFRASGDRARLVDESAAILSELSRQLGLLFLPDDGFRSEEDACWEMRVQGLRYLLEQPECSDISKLRPLVQIIEERDTLTKWIGSHAEVNRSRAYVGSEHQVDELNDYAIVTARYDGGRDGLSGAIAVIGLKRMAYTRVLPIVTEMACLMGRVFKRMED